jgi:hypothetical protein
MGPITFPYLRLFLIESSYMSHHNQPVKKPGDPADLHSCQHIRAQGNQLGSVTICTDCQVVHLALPTMCFKFDLEAFAALSELVSTAQVRISSVFNVQKGACHDNIVH